MTDTTQVQALLDQGADASLLTPEETILAQQLKRDRTPEWDANLAKELDESELARVAQDVIDRFTDDENSRAAWMERERSGIKLLGIHEAVEPGASFQGASTCVHPGLMEGVIQFQARAMAEIWPAEGPADTIVVGDSSPDRQGQASRVKDFLNYLYTQKMPGAREAMDSLLFRLPLSGSAFKKVYFCPLRRQIVSRFIPPGEIVIPYGAEHLSTTPRLTHVMRVTKNDLKRMTRSGFYRQIDDLSPGDETSQYDQTLQAEVDAVEGMEKGGVRSEDNRHVLLEQLCYLDLDLPGFEDTDDGVAVPYVITVEKESQQVLAIRRNWDQDDDTQTPILNYVHYKFLPGFGFYGLGLLHIAGFLSRSSTGALRALLDAADYANNPGGFLTADVRATELQKGEAIGTPAPGHWVPVASTREELNKGFFIPPHSEPNPVLLQLLQLLDQTMRRLMGTTEDLVGDNTTSTPVGTTLARIEQGLKPQVGIHQRIHQSLGEELKITARLCARHLPAQYPYALNGKPQTIFSQDFDERVDVIPVSDPNIVSSTQRLVMMQGLVQMAQEAPDVIDKRQAYEQLLQAMRVPNYESLLVSKQPPAALDPISENMLLQTSQAVKVYPEQNHLAHITVHRAYLSTLPTDQQKGVAPGFNAHIAEHMAMDYYLAMHAGLGGQVSLSNPLMGQEPLPPEFEAQVAVMAAQIAQTIRPPSHTAPPAPDPQDAAVAAKIQREDALATSRSQREDALALNAMARKNAEQEADLLARFMSSEGEANLQPKKQAK